jgi:hypothetical protein
MKAVQSKSVEKIPNWILIGPSETRRWEVCDHSCSLQAQIEEVEQQK